VTTKEIQMTDVGLLVRVEAKAGKADDVAAFLAGAVDLVRDEPQTKTWFAIRLGPTTFGIFDTFADEDGRRAHLSGRVAAALMENAPVLLAQDPVIERVDVLAQL
jgi:quinol monooxygenase YgiN